MTHPDEIDSPSVGRQLRKARTLRGLGLGKVAASIGISATQLQEMELGKIHGDGYSNVYYLNNLAGIYQVRTLFFYSEEEVPEGFGIYDLTVPQMEKET